MHILALELEDYNAHKRLNGEGRECFGRYVRGKVKELAENGGKDPEIRFLPGRGHLFSDWLMDPARGKSGVPEEIYIIPDGSLTAEILGEIAGNAGSSNVDGDRVRSDALPDEDFSAYAQRILAAKALAAEKNAENAAVSAQADGGSHSDGSAAADLFPRDGKAYRLALGLIYLEFFAQNASVRYAEKLEKELSREIFGFVCGMAEPELTREAVLLAKAYCRLRDRLQNRKNNTN